jgi:acetylornithine deacetylase/succinyl-diaminopimelate desuccinylase-like protein
MLPSLQKLEKMKAPSLADLPTSPHGAILSRAIRIALLVAAVALAPHSALAAWPFGAARSEDLGERAADILSRAIQQRTVNPPGDEGDLARELAELLADAGLETRVVPTPAAADDTPAPGDPATAPRAAVWARLPGAGGGRPIILLSHLDVVPAPTSEWSRDPFAGTIEEGWVHGRGALDAKGVMAIQAVTLMELAKRDTPLARDVILLATPDEETGGQAGAGHLVEEHPELLHDAEYLLTEGGSIRPGRGAGGGLAARPAVWGVTITEKSPCWLGLSTRGTPGHGSSPRKDAAVPRLIAALDRVRRAESSLHVLPEVEQMFLRLAPEANEEDRAGYVALRAALKDDSAFRRRFLANPTHNALVRNTVSITVLEGGTRTNVVPARASARLDARLLPGNRCEDFIHAIRSVISDPEVSIEPLLAFESRSSSADSELFRTIERVAERVNPGAVVVPRMIGGFTDAHWFRERGIVAYGFVPRWLTPADTLGIHGPDERVSIENLRRGTEILIAIIEELDAAPPEPSPAP